MEYSINLYLETDLNFYSTYSKELKAVINGNKIFIENLDIILVYNGQTSTLNVKMYI